MDIVHLSLLIRMYALLKNDDVQSIFALHLSTQDFTAVDTLIADIDAYFTERGLRIDHGERQGWGVFPLAEKEVM